ncbi:MAG: hypothetical protein IJ668_04080 [Selenomonadaceae bacterium]|nr:hypothetical protein [Selenomonadaceae bacterium]
MKTKEGALAWTWGGSLLFSKSMSKRYGGEEAASAPRIGGDASFSVQLFTTGDGERRSARLFLGRLAPFLTVDDQNVGEEKRRPPRDTAATLLFFPTSLAQKNVMPLKNFLVFGDRLCYNRQLKLVITYV